ncbi:MAG: 5'-deoxyadenosine deaminase [Desulfotomaculaceae bacterium]|nr:5'-deoxyadenosine deaminase [Desulfotomaculaceae bacterium]
MQSILFKDAVIVTMNPNREIIRGNLLVAGDRIKSISKTNEEINCSQIKVINANGRVLIPGLVQAHIHLCQTLFRGLAEDLALLDWLKLYIWPLEGAHDPDSLYYSALVGIGELFRGGTTAVIDMGTVRHTDTLFAAIHESGIRAVCGKCMMDQIGNCPKYLLENTVDSIQESVDLLEKWHGRSNGLLHYAFTPRFAISCSEEMLLQVKDLAGKYKVRIHTHASENKMEVALIQQQRKMRNIMYFKHLDMINSNLILAHCIWLDSKEMEILQENRVNIVHCPSSNLKLGSGIASIPEMLARKIYVSLGSDGAPCNNTLDMFTEMRTAALIQKPLHGPAAMPALTAFELATLGGAKAMGLEKEIGSLEVGKKADLALIDLKNLHCTPNEGTEIYSQLIYQAKSSDVTLTMVDGKIVYENGLLTTIDEEDVIRKANTAIKRVYRKAEIIKNQG